MKKTKKTKNKMKKILRRILVILRHILHELDDFVCLDIFPLNRLEAHKSRINLKSILIFIRIWSEYKMQNKKQTIRLRLAQNLFFFHSNGFCKTGGENQF